MPRYRAEAEPWQILCETEKINFIVLSVAKVGSSTKTNVTAPTSRQELQIRQITLGAIIQNVSTLAALIRELIKE